MVFSTLYSKLPYLSSSNFAKRKLQSVVRRHRKNVEINSVFSSLKIKCLMNDKDFVPKSHRSNVIYKLNCARCKSVCVGEKSRYLPTTVCEHIHSDKNSHICMCVYMYIYIYI